MRQAALHGDGRIDGVGQRQIACHQIVCDQGQFATGDGIDGLRVEYADGFGLADEALAAGGVGGDGYKIFILKKHHDITVMNVFSAVFWDRVSGIFVPVVVALNMVDLAQRRGLSLEDVRVQLINSTVNAPKGSFDGNKQNIAVYVNDQIFLPAAWNDVVVAYRNGAPVRLTDLGEVVDSVEDLRNAGSADGKPSVLSLSAREIEVLEREREARK